jgi:hypothetical protein
MALPMSFTLASERKLNAVHSMGYSMLSHSGFQALDGSGPVNDGATDLQWADPELHALQQIACLSPIDSLPESSYIFPMSYL